MSLQKFFLFLIAVVLGAQSVCAEDALTLFFSPSPHHQDIVDGINAAHTSVQMVIFHVDDPEIIQALTQAKARGVKVQVLTDQLNLLVPAYNKARKALEAGGVSVYPSSSAFLITHQKTMVIDDTKAFVTTMNLGKNTVEDTRDWGVITEDPAIIREMDAVFQADLDNAAHGTKLTPILDNPNLIWSPVNAESRLVELIGSAHSQIIGTVENLGSPIIQKALEDAAARGVKVKMISPLCDIAFNPYQNISPARHMRAAGVDARLMPGPKSASRPYIHAKMLVIDSERAYLGSVNFTQSSLHKAREAGIIFSNAAAMKTMSEEFEKDWSQAVDADSKFLFCKPTLFDAN